MVLRLPPWHTDNDLTQPVCKETLSYYSDEVSSVKPFQWEVCNEQKTRDASTDTLNSAGDPPSQRIPRFSVAMICSRRILQKELVSNHLLNEDFNRQRANLIYTCNQRTSFRGFGRICSACVDLNRCLTFRFLDFPFGRSVDRYDIFRCI